MVEKWQEALFKYLFHEKWILSSLKLSKYIVYVAHNDPW